MGRDRGAAGEDQVVEWQRGECRSHVRAAEDDRKFLFVKAAGNQFRKQCRCARRQLRRLEHGAVACGEGTRQWAEGERDGKIPRADDANHAERLVFDARLGAGKGGRPRFGLHPFAHMFAAVFQRVNGAADIGEQGLLAAAIAKVNAYRVGNC